MCQGVTSRCFLRSTACLLAFTRATECVPVQVCVCVWLLAAGLHRYTGHRSHGAAIIHRQGWRWIMLPPLPPPGPRPLAGQAFGWPAVIKQTAGCLSAWQITSLILICTHEHANTPPPPPHPRTHKLSGLSMRCKKKHMQEAARFRIKHLAMTDIGITKFLKTILQVCMH